MTKIIAVSCLWDGGSGGGVEVGGRVMGTENNHLYRGSPLPLSSHFGSLDLIFSPLCFLQMKRRILDLKGCFPILCSWIPRRNVRDCTVYVCWGVRGIWRNNSAFIYVFYILDI